MDFLLNGLSTFWAPVKDDDYDCLSHKVLAVQPVQSLLAQSHDTGEEFWIQL